MIVLFPAGIDCMVVLTGLQLLITVSGQRYKILGDSSNIWCYF